MIDASFVVFILLLLFNIYYHLVLLVQPSVLNIIFLRIGLFSVAFFCIVLGWSWLLFVLIYCRSLMGRVKENGHCPVTPLSRFYLAQNHCLRPLWSLLLMVPSKANNRQE